MSNEKTTPVNGMYIEYKNDGKLKDSSWSATLKRDPDNHNYGPYMAYASFNDARGSGANKGEAHNNLIIALQHGLAQVHSFLMTLTSFDKETVEETYERNRKYFGYW